MNLGMPEILIVLLVALLLFGPRKLPELGRSLGQSIREFQRGARSIREEFEKAADVKELKEVKDDITKPLQEVGRDLNDLSKEKLTKDSKS